MEQEPRDERELAEEEAAAAEAGSIGGDAGMTDVPPEEQAHRYLDSVGLAWDGQPFCDHVRMLEGFGLWRHAWQPRDQALYLARLGG